MYTQGYVRNRGDNDQNVYLVLQGYRSYRRRKVHEQKDSVVYTINGV